MSQSTCQQSAVMQQRLQESSEKAHNSQVTTIHSHGLQQVMTSLVLLSVATQLSRKEGITIPEPKSSKYLDNTMLLPNSEFIPSLATHPETDWKIDVWKTGGLSYFSPASTSLDMTQPADNINLITTRHMSKTVVQNFRTMMWFIMQPTFRPKSL